MVNLLEIVVEVGDVQRALQFGDAVLGERRRLVLFVEREVALRRERGRELGVAQIVAGGGTRRPADDERRPRFVYEDVVHFVHDAVGALALNAVVAAGRHVVAQVIEAELVVCAVGDVGGVGFLARGGAHMLEAALAVLVKGVVDERAPVLERAHAHAERVVHRAHPVGVAPREVVVDGHDVNAAPRQRVEIGGQRGDERLALARLHLRYLALMQNDAADELDIVVALPKRALGGFADGGERPRQQRVQALAAGRGSAQVLRLNLQVVVRHALEFGFERVNLIHFGPEFGDDLLIRPSEQFGEFAEHFASAFWWLVASG